MKKQITDTVLMIRPVRFRTNEETIVNNYFQKGINITQEEINRKAQQEFDTLVQKLREVGVHVIQVEDIYEQDTPDSILIGLASTTMEMWPSILCLPKTDVESVGKISWI